MKRKRPLNRLGNREDMFGYHSHNLHFVCVTCRKMFNQSAGFRRHHETIKPIEATCPECDAKMINAGRNFKPPRRNNIKQWKKMELLLQCGYRWDYETERYDIPKASLPPGVLASYYSRRIFNDPKAKTLREAKEDYPPRR